MAHNTYDPFCGACLDHAVGELDRQGRCVVTDRAGIGADDSGGDGSEVVGEEGLGRRAAEPVHSGVVPVGSPGGLGELAEEADHVG